MYFITIRSLKYKCVLTVGITKTQGITIVPIDIEMCVLTIDAKRILSIERVRLRDQYYLEVFSFPDQDGVTGAALNCQAIESFVSARRSLEI